MIAGSKVQQTAKTHFMQQAKIVDNTYGRDERRTRDAEVGRRVRSRGWKCRLSQTELADRIGVNFQQVQKYEKGVNRIAQGRLQRHFEALEVPISFFFGGPGSGGIPKGAQRAGAEQRVRLPADLGSDPHGQFRIKIKRPARPSDSGGNG